MPANDNRALLILLLQHIYSLILILCCTYNLACGVAVDLLVDLYPFRSEPVFGSV